MPVMWREPLRLPGRVAAPRPGTGRLPPGNGRHGTIAKLWGEACLSPNRQSYDESLMAGKDTLRPCPGELREVPVKQGSVIRKSGRVFLARGKRTPK
jgi:hypothetical protein